MAIKPTDFTAWGSEDRYKLACARGALTLVEHHLTMNTRKSKYRPADKSVECQIVLEYVQRVLKETADKPKRARKVKR